MCTPDFKNGLAQAAINQRKGNAPTLTGAEPVGSTTARPRPQRALRGGATPLSTMAVFGPQGGM